MSKVSSPTPQEINLLIYLQSNLVNLNLDNFLNTEIALTSSVWCNQLNLIPQLIHNLIVTAVYRPYSNGLLAKLIVSLSKAMPADFDFTSLLVSSLLGTILERSYTPLRGATMSLLMNLVLENLLPSVNDVISIIKEKFTKKSNYELVCFNFFVWLAPEIESNNSYFFNECMEICEKMKLEIDSLYPTVQRFLFDLPKLQENEWQNLKQRRNSTIKIFSSIFKRNDIENLVQLSFHPQFNPTQKVAQSIYETSFVVSNSPSLVEFAAFCGAIDCFEFLMENGADPTDTDTFQKTIQEFAACGGNSEIINELNDNGFNCTEYNHLKARFFFDTTEISGKVLLAASYSNNFKVIQICLSNDNNIEVDYTDSENGNKTALIIAAQYGHLELIRFLLSKGADVNKQDKDGLSPLQHACQNGYLEIVKLLLNVENIDVNSKHKFDMTSLHWSCQKGFAEIVKLLIDTNKVDINGRDDENWTPLHFAVQNCHDDVLDILLNYTQKGVIQVNVHQKDDMTPLHFAATTGNVSALKKILDFEGIEINAKDNGGLTPLHWACQNGKDEIVKTLVELFNENPDRFNLDVNQKDDESWTALHWAAQNDNHKSIVELSKAKNVNINMKDKQGMTPFMLAVLNSSINAVKAFLSLETVDLNEKDETGKTALHLASRSGDLELLRILVSNEKIDVNCQQANKMTPLHLAVANNKVDAVKVLLSAKGIKKDVKDEEDVLKYKILFFFFNTTPLDAAKIMGYIEIEKLLA